MKQSLRYRRHYNRGARHTANHRRYTEWWIVGVGILSLGIAAVGWQVLLPKAEILLATKMAHVPHDVLLAADEPLKPKTTAATTPMAPAPIPAPDNSIPPIRNGLAPVIATIPTKEPVVFLGIDDGANKQPFELDLMKQYHIKASLFLANRFISSNPAFFKDFVPAGSLIEDHTVDHKLLSHLSYAEQKQEICDQATLEQQEFGRRPVLFRPPGGDYNVDTQRAAADCGMKAVVMWIAKANGGSMQYQIGHTLRAGDIVLMHFRPEFRQDMQAFVNAETAAGLHTELLEDWLSQ